MKETYNKEQITSIIMKIRSDVRNGGDITIAKQIGLSLQTYYKRLALNDWKLSEIERIHEIIK